MPRSFWVHRAFVPLLAMSMVACSAATPRDLAELEVVDSIYVDPSTELPYSGAVFRPFANEADRVQLEGQLLEGQWNGELVVYHPNGRVRYAGAFNKGERCGPWTENADSIPLESVYEELVREVESLGVYPPCDESR